MHVLLGNFLEKTQKLSVSVMRKGKRCLVSHGRQSDQELKAEPEATDSADYPMAPPRWFFLYA